MKKIILVLLGAGLIVNAIVPKRLVVFSGEFLFSFDYLQHVKILTRNYLTWPLVVTESNGCNDCPAFYHISSWYMVWVFALLGIGQVLNFHPAVFYALVVLVSQLLSLKFLSDSLTKKPSLFAVFIASLVFIFIPHKLYLIPSATIDGLIHALIVVIVGIVLRMTQSLQDTSKLHKYSILLGVVLSFFLNIAIAHLPVIAYFLVFVILFNYKTIFVNIKKSLISSFLILIPILFFNFPIISAQLLGSKTHVLSDFIPLSKLDSLLAGNVLAGAGVKSTFLLFTISFFLLSISSLKRQQKLFLILFYFVLYFFLTGGKIATFYTYKYLFEFLPLMDHFRSLYRLISFELIIIFISIFSGLNTLMKSQKKISKLSGVIISMLIVCYLGQNIGLLSSYFHVEFIPNEYFEAARYLNTIPENKLYFPPMWSSYSPSISTNYEWTTNSSVRNPTIYTNPFTSLTPVSNIYNFESVNLSPEYQENRFFAISSLSDPKYINSINKSKKYYLIFDNYYKWDKNEPFTVNFTNNSKIKMVKSFGKISIFSIEDNSTPCIISYGNFMIGHCYGNAPQKLIDKEPRDYVLDKLTSNKEFHLFKPKTSKIPDFIVDVRTRLYVIKKGILLPKTIYSIDRAMSDIFRQKLQVGNYKLFVPILKLSKETNLFNSSTVDVNVDNKIIRSISPYSEVEGFNWEEIDLNVQSASSLTISSNNPSYIVLGNPLLISNDVWVNFESKASNLGIPTVSSKDSNI